MADSGPPGEDNGSSEIHDAGDTGSAGEGGDRGDGGDGGDDKDGGAESAMNEDASEPAAEEARGGGVSGDDTKAAPTEEPPSAPHSPASNPTSSPADTAAKHEANDDYGSEMASGNNDNGHGENGEYYYYYYYYYYDDEGGGGDGDGEYHYYYYYGDAESSGGGGGRDGGEGGAGTQAGGDRDAHGCIPSAGYTWCEASGRCTRAWEEKDNACGRGGGPGPLAAALGSGRLGARLGAGGWASLGGTLVGLGACCCWLAKMARGATAQGAYAPVGYSADGLDDDDNDGDVGIVSSATGPKATQGKAGAEVQMQPMGSKLGATKQGGTGTTFDKVGSGAGPSWGFDGGFDDFLEGGDEATARLTR